MRTHQVNPAFPADAMEVRRLKALHGLGDAAFDALRPHINVWIYGFREFISEREALRAIGRRAVLKKRPADEERAAP